MAFFAMKRRTAKMRQAERTGTTPDSRWAALQRRDPLAEGQFVYAVVTTGVYCRPTCPSRLPNFQNVRFFPAGEEARRAGFRPCKRCKPDSAPEEHAAAAITKAAALIEAAESAPDFKAIAKAAGMSRHHFHRTFKRLLGLTPGAYYRSLRERRAVEGLSKGPTVTEAIYEAGYNSSSRFYEKLAPRLGMHPSAFTKGGLGEVIRFAVGECSLGSILVAATAKGVCAIELGDDPSILAHNFQDRFPNAGLIAGDAGFEDIMAQAIGLVEDPGRSFGLPLHIRGLPSS
jgi:AraC family transcriptional regulator, regulatory protein of adaptative response / methylated-DNA-[protein]-cysteine methyltransferase